MRNTKAFFGVGFALIAGLGLIGCGADNAMTKSELDAASKSKPPTEAQQKQMVDGMAAGFEQAKQQERDYIKSHTPEQVAQVNAARAAGGKPPLGQ